ncbi:TPA: type I toxin-antitoxin system Ibs family toxin [Kluyvera ascorbata]|nr:type I toxin-antitoxin system Ibs family toxin [Kluyvera ascorbata]HAT3945030.1 type I toxin-antitoxin system Ibs family toxin [Kluyvera ascorbata]HAT3950035.1 type I toxin-antitoxin system Ibs family toxin [Kluyvera ascorbata]
MMRYFIILVILLVISLPAY